MIKVKAPQRGVSIASTAGVAIHIPANEIREIPDFMIAEAVRCGCEIVDNQGGGDEESSDPSGEERSKILAGVISDMIAEGDEAEFTKHGYPRVHAVSERAGFSVTSEEVGAIFESLMNGDGQ